MSIAYINEEPPNKTEFEVGKPGYLECELTNLVVDKCSFIIYRIDKNKNLGDNGTIAVRGYRDSSSSAGGKSIIKLKSSRPFEPKISWFEEDENEIQAAFDLEVNGIRISCKDQILIIKRGEAKINLYWGEKHDISNVPHIRIYAEFSKNSDLDLGSSIKFNIERNYPEGFYNLVKRQSIGEEKRTTKNNIIIIESEAINLNYFFEWFCIINLKANIKKGSSNSITYVRTPEEKEVRRTQPIDPNDIHTVLEENGLVPPFFYDYKLTRREAGEKLLKLYTFLDTTLDIVGVIKKGDFGIALSAKIKSQLLDNLRKYFENKINHKFYKEEYGDLIEDFNNTRGNRLKMFRIWFVNRNGFNPDHPNEKKKNQSNKEKRDEIIKKAKKQPNTTLWESDHSAWIEIKKLDKKIDKYNRIKGFYDIQSTSFYVIENTTVEAVKSMIEKSPNSSKY